MMEEGIMPDRVAATSLVQACIEAGDTKRAESIFDRFFGKDGAVSYSITPDVHISRLFLEGYAMSFETVLAGSSQLLLGGSVVDWLLVLCEVGVGSVLIVFLIIVQC